MTETPMMVKLVKILSVVFILFACLMLLIYSPFYSQWVVNGLNRFISFEVNDVAAKSQQLAALSEVESLEPGSPAWMARQAYLQVLKEQIETANSQNIPYIQARYKILQQKMREQNEQDHIDIPIMPWLAQAQTETSAAVPSMDELLKLKATKNQGLIHHYVEFLLYYPLDDLMQIQVDNEIFKDIAFIHQQNVQIQQKENKPYAIVVLGGGLMLAENGRDIVVNHYTRTRLEKTLEVQQQYKLPIVLSGVEAPYMQRWLQKHQVEAKLLENRSMNTCENTRFSSLLLQKQGGAPTVILITDRYHMPRTRRLFALNGIETLPIEAPMPTALSSWQPSERNYDHSRRANYELLAILRDLWFGSSDCREVP